MPELKKESWRAKIHPPALFGLEDYLGENFSPRKISKLTVLPYYRPFLPGFCDKTFQRQWRLESFSTHRYMLLSERMCSEIKFCRECRSDLYKSYGRLVWLRAHQLPGVLVCWKHQTALYSSAGRMTQFEFPSDPDQGGATRLVDDVNEDLILLAQLSKELLERSWPFYSNFVHMKMYYEQWGSHLTDWRQDVLRERWSDCWSGETLQRLTQRYGLMDISNADKRLMCGDDIGSGNPDVYLLPLKRLLDLKAEGSSLQQNFQKCDKFQLLAPLEDPRKFSLEDNFAMKLDYEHWSFIHTLSAEMSVENQRSERDNRNEVFNLLISLTRDCKEFVESYKIDRARLGDMIRGPTTYVFQISPENHSFIAMVQSKNRLTKLETLCLILQVAIEKWNLLNGGASCRR